MADEADMKDRAAIAQQRDAPVPVRVLVVTPVGVEGRGGIDRLNSYFSAWVSETAAAVHLTFLGSRGEWRGPFWILHFLFALLRFTGALMLRRHDVVHIHVSTDGSALRKVMFGRLARLARMPFVIQYHGMMSAAILQANPLWLRALRVLAGDAQRVILLGHAFREPFVKGLGCAPEKITIVHNGVPDAGAGACIPRSADAPVTILFAGEVGERKGVDVLIGALARMRASNDESLGDWRCVIAGNGDIDHWRRQAMQAGLAAENDEYSVSRVRFTGWLDAAGVRELMRDADILVLPSRAEALPLSLIEGASAGVALIATDVGAVRDVVVDGVNGLIVEREADDLAQAIIGLTRDRDMLAQMQVQSRAHYCNEFTMARYGEAILDSYTSLRAKG